MHWGYGLMIYNFTDRSKLIYFHLLSSCWRKSQEHSSLLYDNHQAAVPLDPTQLLEQFSQMSVNISQNTWATACTESNVATFKHFAVKSMTVIYL